MSADNRKVTTDALETLGTIIGENEKRDAIHLAVEPAIAAHPLEPGEHVGFVLDGNAVGKCPNPVGIVDPFLKGTVFTGQRFWLVVYPRQITSLRHVWTHPAFDTMDARDSVVASKPSESGDKADSEKWLTNYAREVYSTYEELLLRTARYLDYNEYWSDGGLYEGYVLPDEFWVHYQLVTGRIVDRDLQQSFFSCSC